MKWHYLRFGWWFSCTVIYLWFFAGASLNAWRHPFLNWDMVNYMGVVESFSTHDPARIYNATMDDARSVYDQPAYDNITQKNILSNRADAFYQQLPICKVKPLYTGGIWVLHALGMPMAESTWVLSIAAFLAVAFLCYSFIPSGVDAGIWWLIVWGFCIWGPFPMRLMPHLSTPDTLCTALCLGAYCLWGYRRSFAGFAVCLWLAQLARPDALILSLAMTLFFTCVAEAEYRLPWRKGVGCIAVAITMCVLVAYLAGSYGWKTLFYYTFIRRLAYPADVIPQFGWERYAGILHYGVVKILANPRLQAMLAASLIATGCSYALSAKRQRMFIGVVWVVWLAFAARFVIFPAWGEDRFYYPYYFIMLFAIADSIPPIKLLQYGKIGISSKSHD